MIGPAIPEAILKKKQEKNEAEIEVSFSDDDQEEEQTVGPQIPAHILQRKRQTPVAGPQMPDHLMHQNQNEDEITISDENDHDSPSIGPQMPQQRVDQQIGPSIPHHLIQRQEKAKNTDEIIIEEGDDAIINPPSSLSHEEEENPNDYAPALPPDLLQQRQQQPQPVGGRRRRPVGPTFPTGPVLQQTNDDDDDDNIVGPALPKDYNPEEEAKYSAILAIEERARQSKEAMEKKEQDAGKVQRPEWMLVPPEVDYLKKANSSRSRQFTNKTMTKEQLDSTEWTETPAEKQRRLEEQRSGKRKAEEETVGYSALDLEKKRNVEQYNMQTRPLTLLEMHQQKKKKKGITAEEDVTKRAFDREKDLLGHKPMDQKKKKEMFQKSAELGQKFGYGSSSFL